MSGFEVAMVGSTQTQIFQIEDLLRSLGTTRRSEDAASARSSSFDSRPIIAAFLAFFVFAPGCAAAAVFLMRADGNIPPITTPDSNQPFVAKSDRLPLVQWSAEAVENADPKNDIRFAVAETLADSASLDSLLIRGSLEDGTVTPISDSPSLPNSFASRDKPSVETSRPKRIVSRVKPPKLLAAVAPPEPPQPSFFEKLFGPHVN